MAEIDAERGENSNDCPKSCVEYIHATCMNTLPALHSIRVILYFSTCAHCSAWEPRKLKLIRGEHATLHADFSEQGLHRWHTKGERRYAIVADYLAKIILPERLQNLLIQGVFETSAVAHEA